MSNDQSYFYAAIGITAQDDCYSLTQHTVALLQSLTFVRNATVFEAYRQEDVQEGYVMRRFTYDLDETRVAPDEPGLADCARRKAPQEITLDNGQTRLVFPVESKVGPLRLMAIEGESISPEERVLLLNLVTLFANQVNVLDGKERDSLTGLLNRQTFDLRLMQVTELRKQHGGTAWLGAFDIDHFKRVNDTYGHLYGDEVLLHFGQLMQRSFRYTDFLFRFGGEEFIVILSNTDAEGAAQTMERFRKAVAEYDFPAVGRVTNSIGYTQIEPGTLPTTLVDWADKALYHAKQTGRNKVVHYADIRQEGDRPAESDIELF